MMKKIYFLILILTLTLLLTACGSGAGRENEKKQIVCTAFPLYDWTRELIKDTDCYEVSYLLTGGTDLHSFQPTMADMAKISSCDLFIYIGGESEEWVSDVLKSSANRDQEVIKLSEVLSQRLLEEELAEGMEGGAEEGVFDEHIWMSLKNAKTSVRSIAGALMEEGEASQKIENNLTAYLNRLDSLDKEYEQTFEETDTTIIVADRFPFRYLVEDYGIDYYAAFSGCSADSEASFSTITFLATKMKELNAGALFVTESGNVAIAQAILSASGGEKPVYVLNSLQSVTAKDAEAGADYLGIMCENLETLKKTTE